MVILDSGGKKNPLKMISLDIDGPFVLPPTTCTNRRSEFLKRGNTILGFYLTLALYSDKGRETMDALEKSGQLKYDTPIRMKSDKEGIDSRLNYGLLKKLFARAGAQLTNQVFLMVYGNFEAYLLDIIADGLKGLSHTDPQEEAIQLMMGTTWRGKFDRITQKLQIKLGRGILTAKFVNFDMGFFGEKCTDPIDFLDRMADLRHRLVHSTGRADDSLLSKYPNSGLHIGDVISLPFGLPYGIHFFFVLMTEVVDQAFVDRFGWPMSVIAPEKLVD